MKAKFFRLGQADLLSRPGTHCLMTFFMDKGAICKRIDGLLAGKRLPPLMT